MIKLASFSGWCEQGGVRVTVAGQRSTANFQESYPNLTQSGSGPSVTVYLPGTTTKASIYSDDSGAVLANPFPATATGQYLFFAATGSYDLLISGTGISAFTISSVQGISPSSVAGIVNVKEFGAKGDGTTLDTSAVLAAIAYIQAGQTLFFPRGSYRVGSLGTMTKIITLDFGGSRILPDTTGVWLTTSFVSDSGDQFVFRNGIFSQYAAVVPTNIFKLVGQPDTLFDKVTAYLINVSHAFIWNHSSYGTSVCNAKWNYNTVTAGGALFYGSQAYAGDSSTFTYACSINNVDFSNNTALGIAMEGGSLSVTNGTIESCSRGGIEHLSNIWYLTLNIEHVHFELNASFNLKFPSVGTNPNTNITSTVRIDSCRFSLCPSSVTLMAGQATNLMFTNNQSDGFITSTFTATVYSTLYASGNVVYGTPSGGDPNTGYIISTAYAPYVNRNGSYATSSAFFQKSFFRAFTPLVLGTLYAVPGTKIVTFEDDAGAEVGYVNREGDFSIGRDAIVYRNLPILGTIIPTSTTGPTWRIAAENYVADSDLTIAYGASPAVRRVRISGGANPGRVGIGMGSASLTSPLNVLTLQDFANNAAAIGGGLTVGAFYRNGDVVMVVH